MSNIDKMIADIEAEVAYTRHMIGRDKLSPRTMQAMRTVPRQDFVPYSSKIFAFENGPLSIGHNQTISQPYIVALMTDLLELQPTDTVLEVGTGSGYQAAVLSLLAKQVYSMEIIKELSEKAEARLKKYHYDNIETCVGNGYDGWPEHAPYDGIITTAAATHIPPALLEQLKPGGRLVIPVGPHYRPQELMLVQKKEDGGTKISDILGVVFVPLVNEKPEELSENLR